VLTFLKSISERQAFEFWTILAALCFLVAAIRVLRLPKAKDYRPLIWLLIAWAAIYFVVVGVNVQSPLYRKIYMLIVPVTWVLYVFVARNLYKQVFNSYPGIAFAGRWCVYAAAIFSAIGMIVSFSPPPGSIDVTALYWTFSMDRNVVFGISVALLLLILVMSWYPLSVQKNITVHSFYLGAILLIQAAAQLADQSTGYRNQLLWNTLAAGLTAFSVLYWIWSLSPHGDHTIVKIRRNLDPALELQLLSQLDSLNGILLRAARK
jgi:hypothetical protein